MFDTFISSLNFNLGYEIHDMYKIDGLDNNVMTAKYGEWKSDVGLRVLQSNIWRRRADFKGRQIRCRRIIIQNPKS